MNDEEYKALRQKLTKIRKQKVDSEFGIVSASIPYLLKLLKKTHEKPYRRLIYTDLSAESLRMGNSDLSLYFLRKECEEFPEEPTCFSTLSYTLALEAANPEARKEAVELGKKALCLAIEQKRWVKWCGCYLARIALLVNDYESLHFAISKLVADVGNYHKEDYKYEFDFVEQIDSSRFDNELLLQYKNLEKTEKNRMREKPQKL